MTTKDKRQRQANAKRARVESITLIITNNEGESTTRCERATDYTWKIDGPIFPRHIAMLTELNDIVREADGAA